MVNIQDLYGRLPRIDIMFQNTNLAVLGMSIILRMYNIKSILTKQIHSHILMVLDYRYVHMGSSLLSDMTKQTKKT